MILKVRLDTHASPIEVTLEGARVRDLDGVVGGEVDAETVLLAVEQQHYDHRTS